MMTMQTVLKGDRGATGTRPRLHFLPIFTVMDAWLKERGPVELRPFAHLVSGHSLLLELNEDTVCKPLLFGQEKDFYETMPAAIQQFAPKYHGVVALQASKETGSSAVKLLARWKSDVEMEKEDVAEKNRHLCLKKECSPSGFSLYAANGKSEDHCSISNGTANADSGSYQSPWTSFLVGKWQETLLGYDLSAMDMDCLVLENLTCKYRYPCILDLKMGTRSYSDDDTESEKRRKTERYAQTTSLSLGTRICGMQVYDVTLQRYNFKDRLWSRQMSEKEFYHALKEFLFNGKCYRRDIVPGLVAMLRALRDVIKERDSFRFFTSSLLIIYDGVDNDSNCSRDKMTSSTTSTQSATHPHSAPEQDSNGFDNLQEMRKCVDVRMIDFARSTHHGMTTNQSNYLGPDEGYIHGLATLISAFESILSSI